MAFTTIPFDLLGFRVMGDVNGITCYTNKARKKVFYEKAPPDKPASPAQRHRRDLFAAAVRAWRLLSDADKQALERAVHKTSLCLTGQNLFVSCSMKSNSRVYSTIAAQSHETLPPLASL